MMIKNTPVYLKSFVINLKNQLFGIAELNTLVHKNKITEMSDNKIAEGSFLYTIFRDYNIGMVFLHLALFWLFLPSLVFLAIKWRTLPIEIIIAFFVSLIHIFVLAFFSNPAHRFRYPIDPFLYFLQLYLILILLKTVFLKPFKFVFSSKNEGAKNEAI